MRKVAAAEQAAAAVKAWLLAQIEKRLAAPTADIPETAPAQPFGPSAASSLDRTSRD